jgi:integrase/recombinase XerC
MPKKPSAKKIRRQWDKAITGYLTDQRAGGRSETTISARRDQLLHLSRNVKTGPYDLTARELRDFTASRPWKRETRRVRRATFKSFYEWALGEGHVAENIGEKLPKVRMDQGRARPAPDWAYKAALMAAPPRERLMLHLAADLGMRRAEVAQAHTRDLVRDTGGYSLTIHGKGDKDRVVPMPAALGQTIAGMDTGYLFPGNDHGHLSPRFVGRLIAALLPEGWTAHTLRHRFATRAYDTTRDLLLVQEMLGHTSPNTTRRYVQYDKDSMRSVVERLAGGEGIAA